MCIKSTVASTVASTATTVRRCEEPPCARSATISGVSDEQPYRRVHVRRHPHRRCPPAVDAVGEHVALVGRRGLVLVGDVVAVRVLWAVWLLLCAGIAARRGQAVCGI